MGSGKIDQRIQPEGFFKDVFHARNQLQGADGFSASKFAEVNRQIILSLGEFRLVFQSPFADFNSLVRKFGTSVIGRDNIGQLVTGLAKPPGVLEIAAVPLEASASL